MSTFSIEKVQQACTHILPDLSNKVLDEISDLSQQYEKANVNSDFKSFFKLLLSQGYITDEQQLKLLAYSLDLVHGEEYQTQLEINQVDTFASTELNQEFLKKYFSVYLPKPIDKVYSAEPESQELLQYLQLEEIDSEIVVMSEQGVEQVHQALSQFTNSEHSLMADLQDQTLDSQSLKALASQAPVINLLNTLVTRAVLEKASDIHIEPHGRAWKVRFRRDGLLLDAQELTDKLALPIISRIKILANLDIAEKRRPQDGKISMRAASKSVDLRVSTLPVVGGESVVLRILLKEALKFDLTEMGFNQDTLNYLQRDLTQTAGVILLTGPTGSGKTTTLYSFLQQIYDPKLKMITLEDPVEYQFAQINQMQVHSEIGFTFAAGLRSILRQDPDVIMLGEIRDSETAKIALQASMTGHLVFSTVHTNDAASAYARLTDLGVEEYLLNETIISVVAQRLIRLSCPHCAQEQSWSDIKQALATNESLFNLLEQTAHQYDISGSFKQSSGCEQCKHSGYLGRAVIAEYLPNTVEIQQMTKDNMFAQKAKDFMQDNGYRSLKQDAALKVLRGESTVSELIRVVGS